MTMKHLQTCDNGGNSQIDGMFNKSGIGFFDFTYINGSLDKTLGSLDKMVFLKVMQIVSSCSP